MRKTAAKLWSRLPSARTGGKAIFTVAVFLATIIPALAIGGWTAALVAAVLVTAALAGVVLLLKDHLPGYDDLGDGVPGRKLEPASELDPSYRRHIFVYGSLIAPQSIIKTVGAGRGGSAAGSIRCIPAEAYGYELEWTSIVSAGYRRTDGGLTDPRNWHAVTMRDRGRERAGVRVQGAVISVDDTDYFAIRDREYHYREVDVAGRLRALDTKASLPAGRIVAFVAKGEDADPDPAARARPSAVRKRYLDQVNGGLSALGLQALAVPEERGGKPVSIEPAFFAHELFARRLRSPLGRRELDRTQEAIQRVLVRDEPPDSPLRDFGVAPLLLEPDTYEDLLRTSQNALSAATKIVRTLAGHPDVLQQSGYDDADLELLSLGVERDELRPMIARVDLLLTKDGFKVLELNTDSPAGMRQIDVLSQQQSALVTSLGLDWVVAQPTRVVERVLDSLLAPGESGAVDSCALVEFDLGTWPAAEMLHFVERLKERGVAADLIDLKEHPLAFDAAAERLTAKGRSWDRIYKRIVWSDLVTNFDIRASRGALTQAAKQRPGSVRNTLSARVAGTKIVLAALCDERVQEIAGLSELERETVARSLPWTATWGELPSLEPVTGTAVAEYADAVKKRVGDAFDRYVWKPFHGLGGKGITFGTDENPRLEANEKWSKGCVVQEYWPHGRALVPVVSQGGRSSEWRYAVFGVYLVDGEPVAVEAKVRTELPVNMGKGAARTAVFPCRR